MKRQKQMMWFKGEVVIRRDAFLMCQALPCRSFLRATIFANVVVHELSDSQDFIVKRYVAWQQPYHGATDFSELLKCFIQ